jgi:predicted ribosome quality control (RQC) complex YloA/Tae2 family protein
VNKSVRGRIKEKLKEHNKEIGKWEEEEEEGRREAEEDGREAEQVYENMKTVQEKLTQRKKAPFAK